MGNSEAISTPSQKKLLTLFEDYQLIGENMPDYYDDPLHAGDEFAQHSGDE